MKITEIIGLIFKKKGLSNKTLGEINQQIEKYDKEKGLTSIFLTKIKSYLLDYKQFLSKYSSDCCVHVSTDIIESIFGKYKNKANNYALTGLTKLNLELSLYCTTEKEITKKVHEALEDISMTHLGRWIEDYSSDNQLVKRLKFQEKVA